jgi:uncharacterized cysteine cluster protein YcgN (CxxCxxCC family)
MTKQRAFWKTKSLSKMSKDEWESLCDGCGQCCVYKLEDEDSGSIHLTNVACQLLDLDTCRCSDYDNRREQVEDCLVITPQTIADYHWLPSSCAYRLLADGHDLKWWHPLVSGNPRTVHEAGISIYGKVISEEYIHPEQLEEHIIEWQN